MINRFLENKKVAKDVATYINRYIRESMKTKVHDFDVETIFFTVDIDKHKYASFLCSTFCKASGGEYEKSIPVCASLELLHAHFLIIDDIADGSTIRRGNKPSYLKFGLASSLFSSDILFSLSMEILNMLITQRSYNPRLLEVFTAKSKDVNIGQLIDYAYTQKASVSLSEYYEYIDLKVGSLTQLGCLSGFLLGDYTQESFIKVEEFGKYLGRAFQIYDDIVDLLYENENQDIINRNKTFPYVYITSYGSSRNKRALREIYEKITAMKSTKDFRDGLIRIIEEENVVSAALDDLEIQTLNALNSLKDIERFKELTNLCSHLLDDYKNKMGRYL